MSQELNYILFLHRLLKVGDAKGEKTEPLEMVPFFIRAKFGGPIPINAFPAGLNVACIASPKAFVTPHMCGPLPPDTIGGVPIFGGLTG